MSFQHVRHPSWCTQSPSQHAWSPGQCPWSSIHSIIPITCLSLSIKSLFFLVGDIHLSTPLPALPHVLLDTFYHYLSLIHCWNQIKIKIYVGGVHLGVSTMVPYRVWSPAGLPTGEPRNNRKASRLVVYCGQHQCFFLFLFWKTVSGLSKGHRDDPNEWGCGSWSFYVRSHAFERAVETWNCAA